MTRVTTACGCAELLRRPRWSFVDLFWLYWLGVAVVLSTICAVALIVFALTGKRVLR